MDCSFSLDSSRAHELAEYFTTQNDIIFFACLPCMYHFLEEGMVEEDFWSIERVRHLVKQPPQLTV